MSELLSATELQLGYGSPPLLRGLSFSLNGGESLAVLGRNGSGKQALLDALMGFAPIADGELWFGEQNLRRLTTPQRVRLGIAWVPRQGGVFSSLSLEENLSIGARQRSARSQWSQQRVYQMLPALAAQRKRNGNELDAAQQQLAALGRALVAGASLLLLDQPFDGQTEQHLTHLVGVLRQLREEGVSMVLTARDPQPALALSDRAIVLEAGKPPRIFASAEVAHLSLDQLLTLRPTKTFG